MPRSTTADEDLEVTPPRPTERTVVFGYLLAVVVGFVVFQTANMVWSGQVVSRFRLGFVLVLYSIGIIPLWIACAIPFAVVRHICGPQRLASSWVATALGALTGLVAIPCTIEVRRFFDFEGVSPPYAADLLLTIWRHGVLHALGGAAAGLTYSLVEFPGARRTLPQGEGPGMVTGRARARRGIVLLAAMIAIAATVPLPKWWWSPHVTHSLSTSRVTFLREWSAPGESRFVGWLPNGRGIVSLYQGAIAVDDDHGRRVSDREFAAMNLSGMVSGGQDVVIPADYSRKTAFTVFDLVRGIVVHEEPDPAPGPGVAGSAVRLAMTPDGSRLAVAYFGPRKVQGVRVYDPRDWRLVSTMDTVPARAGTLVIAISQNGRLLAFDSGIEVVIADVTTGKTIRALKINPHMLAFSPQGDRVAVQSPDRDAIDIIRVADGATIASYKVPTHWMGGNYKERSMWFGKMLVWDPFNRFVAFDDGGANVILWNPAKSQGDFAALQVRPENIHAAVSPDGTRLVVGNGDAVSLFRLDPAPK